ncbi:hypothetical protein OS493_022350 [Desmophyllum pertusum]|uniref:ShKT domain-containing protein n=1 Tax=Desmophyllum pertusum TaxID=174260 RepID=A0A9X0D808_9CNID|nr:hypothetical protein OS493_022350 [Desmophyllum pertusum]
MKASSLNYQQPLKKRGKEEILEKTEGSTCQVHSRKKKHIYYEPSNGMFGCEHTPLNGMSSIAFYFIISVFQIMTKEAAQGASIKLDVSRLRINPLECYDRADSCPKEADNGFCVSNYNYMVDRCPWSCRFCRRARGDTDKCEDISKNCSEWVSNKECTTRPDFMAQNCKKSCEMCGPESEYKVTDSESICPIWAKAGWCQKDSDLLQKCPHSCQKFGYMGANSLEERYITVNFQNTSSVKAPIITEIAVPPPPSAAMRPHSDLEALPPDLRTVLEKEWWNSKLLQLTQKQNEYVTHPELRPLPLPQSTNETAQLGNNTVNATQLGGQTNGSHVMSNLANQSDGNQPGQMLHEPPAPAPPPSSYDSLLPQLAVSGLTWSDRNEKPEENQENKTAATQENKSGIEEVWKEEKDEDLDLDEKGHQKEEVPIIVSGNEDASGNDRPPGNEKTSGDQDLNVETSSAGNEEEIQEYRNYDNEMEASSDNTEYNDMKTEQNLASSGSGEQIELTNDHVTMYRSPESGQGENVRLIFPEDNFSGSGQLEQQQTSDAIIASSYGSGQYEADDQEMEMASFSGSGE